MKKVVVIGAGIAGLAAAVRLACAGYKVTVIEANTYPGGKLSAFEKEGYRFDAGPSLFTLPHLVTELFTFAGKDPSAYFEYIRLEKAYSYFYEDGTRFTAYHNREQFAEELKQQLGLLDATPLFTQLDRAAFRYRITAPLFVEQSLHRLQNFINFKTLSGIWNVFKLNLFSSMHDENDRLFADKRLVQYFNRFATYNGSNPYSAPALLNMIPHLEHNIGTFFPKKGMHQITQSIFTLACELGVDFRFGQAATEIITQGNHVSGVKVGQQFIEADLVVSNADIHTTYRKLLPGHPHPDRLLNQEKSSSALIFYWGVKQSFPELDLHNILFSADYKKEFNCLFNAYTIYEDPTIYINITSKYKPDDAPKGCENWFVMINVPNNRGQNWDELITVARKQVVAKINRLLHTDIESLIEVEELLDPRTIELKTSSYAGALYGNASNNRFAAFLRHKNFSSSINGLYCCGGSVHPGGGIPLCLNSAKIVSSLIAEREG